jgi:hypothetical protein
MILAENRIDRIYDWMLTFDTRAYRHQRLRPVYAGTELVDDYADDRYGFIVSAGQVMDKLGNVEVQLKGESSRIDFSDSQGSSDTRREFRSIIVRSLIDSYDQYPFPRNGMLNIIYVESAGEVLGGTERYVKLFWGSTITRTFQRRHTLTGSMSLGTSDPSMPASESFSLGGSPARLDCSNPETASSMFYADFPGLRPEQRTGSRLAAGRLSYRLFIPKYFYMEFTYAAGNVWKSRQTIRAESLLQSYGVRGTFDTYIGQLSLGWGITSHGEDHMTLSAGREF